METLTEGGNLHRLSNEVCDGIVLPRQGHLEEPHCVRQEAHRHRGRDVQGDLRASGVQQPAITVFRQRIAGKPDPRVWNNLMCQYAGYEMEDGSIVGDPAASGLTKVRTSSVFMLL